jgi:hypothetical protein
MYAEIDSCWVFGLANINQSFESLSEIITNDVMLIYTGNIYMLVRISSTYSTFLLEGPLARDHFGIDLAWSEAKYDCTAVVSG